MLKPKRTQQKICKLRIFVQHGAMKADEIKQYLEALGYDRQWLAEQIGVKKSTVDGWLSARRPISSAAQKSLSNLFIGKRQMDLTLSFSEHADAIEFGRQDGGLGPAQWASKIVRQELERRRELVKAAETPAAPTTTKPKPVNYRKGIRKKISP